jgi:rhodanese-related sulfurtransferase
MIGALKRLFQKPPSEPRWLDIAALQRQLAGEAPLVLDVRGLDEFDGPLGHIDGARNIPLPELSAHQVEIAAQLTAAGVGDVSVLRGGMKAWREAGL